MVDTDVQVSLWDVSMVGSSGAKVAEVPSTDAQTDGVIDMQTSPQV